jgi:hypothetical protein
MLVEDDVVRRDQRMAIALGVEIAHRPGFDVDRGIRPRANEVT